MEAKTITVIPKKTIHPFDFETGKIRKKRVCAYARVSTDMEDQKNSFNAQSEYYQDYIKRNPEWEFIKLYSDEGISGTSIKNRKGFQQMIRDAMNGNIDLILTKSISRFARNTVDCLQKVRDLRSKGVTVFFEKENISTDDTKIEMMLTIFASMAQEESKSISENVKWGVRKRMAKGERKVNAKHLMGYELDENENLVIVNEEAELVKEIFNLYISGYSYREICDYLNELEVKTKTGKDKWTVNNIHSILSNEKYCGDVILQKTVVVDFLTHKTMKNDGIEPQYLIENHHQAIVPKEQYQYVQELRKFNSDNYSHYMNSNSNLLAGLIYCENCLRPLYRIKQHPNKTYQRYVMTCKNQSKKNINYTKCSLSKTLDYNALLKASAEVFDRFFAIPNSIKENLKCSLIGSNTVSNFSARFEEINDEINCLENRLKDIISMQIKSSKHDEFKNEFISVKKEIENKKYELEQLRESTFKSYTEKTITDAVDTYLKDKTCIEPSLFRTIIKKIIAMHDGSVRFIIGTKDLNLDKRMVNKIRGITPIYSSKVKNGAFEIRYDVIKEDDLND